MTASEKVPNGEDMDVWRMVMCCQNMVRIWAKCECVKFQIIDIKKFFKETFFQMRNIWYICSGIAEEWLCGWKKDEPTTKL